MNHFLQTVRALVFYAICAVTTVLFSLLAYVFIWFMPLRGRFSVIVLWTHLTLWLARVICGLRYRIHGLDNLPVQGAFVVLAKHQSAWETFLLLSLLKPVSIILKQELLKIPAFGWGLATIKPIAIDRSNPKKAMRQIREEGLKRLRELHMPVLIFPEGTRIAAGQRGKYARGGAALAIEAGVPVVFVAHNAGYFWPTGQLAKTPGIIDVYISPPQPSGEYASAKALTDAAEQWIEAHVHAPQNQDG